MLKLDLKSSITYPIFSRSPRPASRGLSARQLLARLDTRFDGRLWLYHCNAKLLVNSHERPFFLLSLRLPACVSFGWLPLIGKLRFFLWFWFRSRIVEVCLLNIDYYTSFWRIALIRVFRTFELLVWCLAGVFAFRMKQVTYLNTITVFFLSILSLKAEPIIA